MIATKKEIVDWRGPLLLLPLVLFLLAFLVVPIAGMARTAFASGVPSFDRVALLALRNSIAISVVVAVVSVLLCLAPAYLLSRDGRKSSAIVRMLLMLPLTFSGVVIGFLAIAMLGRVGAVPRFFEWATGHSLLAGAAYTVTGLVLAYLYFEIPRALFALESAFRTVDPELEQAAATLGAGRRARWTRVILPMVWRQIVVTLLLTFSVSLGSYGVALMLSRRLTFLPLEIYVSFTGMLDDQRAALLSMTLVVISLLTGTISTLLVRKAAR